MKWFKHMTNSSLDERLSRFTDKYGLEAYGFFWRVLEAIAANVDETDRKHVEYSIKTWCKLLGIRPQTFRKLAQESSILGLFQVRFNSDLVCMESSNILKYRDEWTRKKKKTPEQNSEKDKETEKEEEQEEDRREGEAHTHEPPPPKSSVPSRTSRSAKKPQPEKSRFGENGNVLLTAGEHDSLCRKYSSELTEKAIALLDLHIGAKGKDEYKSHNLALQKWVFDAVKEREQRHAVPSRASPHSRPMTRDEQVRAHNDAVFQQLMEDDRGL
jgi:hypothetical protein